MTEFERTGKFTNGTKVSELIEYLKGHMGVYGDTPVHFSIEGEEEIEAQFHHYANSVTIDLSEAE